MKLICCFFFCIQAGLFVQAQTTQTKFEKQIIELIKLADDDFAGIKGEEIIKEETISDGFKSKLELEGATENKITEGLWIRFVAGFPAQKDSSIAFDSFNKMSGLIKKALGDKATMKTNPLQEKVSGFDITKVQMTEFRKHENKADAYYVELKIYRSAAKMKLFSSSPGWTTELVVYKKLEY